MSRDSFNIWPFTRMKICHKIKITKIGCIFIKSGRTVGSHRRNILCCLVKEQPISIVSWQFYEKLDLIGINERYTTADPQIHSKSTFSLITLYPHVGCKAYLIQQLYHSNYCSLCLLDTHFVIMFVGIIVVFVEWPINTRCSKPSLVSQ